MYPKKKKISLIRGSRYKKWVRRVMEGAERKIGILVVYVVGGGREGERDNEPNA